MNYKHFVVPAIILFTCLSSHAQGPKVRDTLLLDVKSTKKGGPATLSFKGQPVKDSVVLNIKESTCVLKVSTNGNKFRIFMQSTDPNTVSRLIPVAIGKDTLIHINPPTGTPGVAIGNAFLLNVAGSDTIAYYSNIAFVLNPVSSGATVDTADEKAVVTDKAPFVDSAMLASVSGRSACLTCDSTAIVRYRSRRKLQTDYFIIFDRSFKFDAYTICKHIFRKHGDSMLIERYKKVPAALFAPHVGSQLHFQVLNFKLTEKLKIVTDSGDLFLNSQQFQSVLTAQLNATILKVNVPAADTAQKPKPGDKATGQGGSLKETPEQKLDRLYNEVAGYVIAFNGSPCTIDYHQKHNMPILMSRIRTQFELSPGNSTGIIGGLTDKFKSGAAEQKAGDVAALLTSLDTLRPLAFATPRLSNRDYYNIKVLDGSDHVLSNTNIRTSFGLKIDFSSGVFLTGLRDFNYIFKDTSFKYKPVDSLPGINDTSGRIIVRETDNKVNLGFGFLAHVYPRFSSNYNIGIATGFMATTNLDLNLLLGGSVMFQSLFGANTRVALSGGMVWGKVNRLSKSVYEGYKEVNGLPVFYPTSINTPSVVKVWQRSWFFGVTYNF